MSIRFISFMLIVRTVQNLSLYSGMFLYFFFFSFFLFSMQNQVPCNLLRNQLLILSCHSIKVRRDIWIRSNQINAQRCLGFVLNLPGQGFVGFGLQTLKSCFLIGIQRSLNFRNLNLQKKEQNVEFSDHKL